jgi:hypothetical protein
MTGKIARWESGICPVIVGQSPAVANLVTGQVRGIAKAVGAPINDQPSCQPNIEIVFTTTPQALLDDIRAHETDYLGYAAGSAEREKLATVTRPIQAWYTTATTDLRGISRVDSARPRGALPDARFASVTGNHLTDGTRSALNHVIIVVDPGKLAGQEISPLTDYIAVLALAQLNAPDSCLELPSVVNLLASGCRLKAAGLTATDLAFLRGLYKMSPAAGLISQQNDIAGQMKETLGR